MRLILLSGGSGQRLWPLSNGARSKQFLKVLQNGGNEYESMIQRVWHQLERAELADRAVIATNKAQVDMLKAQLGQSPPLIIEPERRDTFPAIALAAAYLYSEQQTPEDETVCICPVDPFVEDHFFRRLAQLDGVLRQSGADMALMGVRPVFPSNKYGYIVPETADSIDGYRTVRHFREKPSVEEAAKLIGQQALWNCGVFAFRLAHLLNILEEKSLPRDYKSLLAMYRDLPKNSFDYEVVEKAERLVVLPYEGQWKDLGTWTTLTEEMAVHLKGKGLISEDSLNTHVVNELDIPITVIGISDAVIAASPDGILVADKEASPRVKELIDHDQRPMYEERFWGWFKTLDYTKNDDGDEVLTKRVCVEAGRGLSYQYHRHRTETWNIINGEAEVTLDGETRRVRAGEVIRIAPGQKHSLLAVTNVEFIEIQAGPEITDEDVVRLAPVSGLTE